jgi:hypothetical protein
MKQDDWAKIAVEACRIAVAESGINDPIAVNALHAVEMERDDTDSAASVRGLAERLDQEAWDAQEADEQNRYDLLFRSSRAASALAYALSGSPDEAIYEAAYAAGTPEDLVRLLRS